MTRRPAAYSFSPRQADGFIAALERGLIDAGGFTLSGHAASPQLIRLVARMARLRRDGTLDASRQGGSHEHHASGYR